MKILLLVIFLCSINIFGQKIEIISVEKKGNNQEGYLLIKCQLINNTNEDIILPRLIDEYNNSFSYFYRIETKPKKAFDIPDHPPYPIAANYYKLTKEDILKCSSKASIEFELDTRKMRGGELYLRWVENIENIEKIRIVYSPFIVENKEKNMEKEIKNIKFYHKKIQSKFFVLKK